MAKRVLPFKLNKEKLLEKYASLVYKDDAFESTLLFNRIMEDKRANNSFEPVQLSESLKTLEGKIGEFVLKLNDNEKSAITLRQVTVYGRLNAHGMEIDNLLKVLTNEDFRGFDAVAVLNRLVTFFGFLIGVDVYDYYLNMLKNRFPNDERLKSIQKPLEDKLPKGIHFVDDGNHAFNAALSRIVQGDYNGAMEKIDSKSRLCEKDFRVKNLEVAMLLSMGAEQQAVKLLEELESAGCRDAEFYANLYQLSKINSSYIDKTINMLEIEPKLSSSYDLMVILASLYVMKNEYEKAVNLLINITGIKKDGREVLKLLSECYYALQEKEKLEKILKRVVTLYPNDIWARWCLLNEGFDLISNINTFQNDACDELKKYLLDKTRDEDAFNSMDRPEAYFLFKSLEEIRETLLSKQIIEKIYHSKHKDILFDALISVHSDSVTLQLIFQVLVEQKFDNPFFTLKDCELRKYHINLPRQFKIEQNDVDKSKFLLTCYAQTLALIFYLGFDLTGAEEKLEKPIEWLFSQDLLNDELLFRDECVVYLLSNALYLNNEYIERTFKKLKKAERQKIVSILEKIR